MATDMSPTPAFTTPNRRKRPATYGKGSRRKSTFTWDEPASTERPRKEAGGLVGTSQEPSSASGVGASKPSKGSRGTAPKPATERDIFDVPSDADMSSAPAPVTAKKLPRKHPSKESAKPAPKQTRPTSEYDIPSSDEEAVLPQRRHGKTPQTAAKPKPLRSVSGTVQAIRKTRALPQTSSDDTAVPVKRRAKTPQLAQKENVEGRKGAQLPKATAPSSRTASRGTTPAPPGLAKKPASRPAPPAPKSSAGPSKDLDVFDVPSSDDEMPTVTRKRTKPIFQVKGKGSKSAQTTSPASTDSDASNVSNVSKKRKRYEESTSVEANAQAISEAQPKRKAQKKTINETAGQKNEQASASGRAVKKPAAEPTLNNPPVSKPRRTRPKNAPGPPRAPVKQNLSSPAKLHGMLAVRSVPKPVSPVTPVGPTPLDDETMYDIPDSSTPGAKPFRPDLDRSITTPSQKDTLSNLLGTSFELPTPGTAMPSIRRLQLTDRKPTLGRSSSDIPQSTYTRTRLLDALRRAASSSGEDTESDEETEQEIIDIPAESKSPAKVVQERLPVEEESDDGGDEMDVDSQDPGFSQNSQASLHTNASKVTYARQRTYREEASGADQFLLDMDLGDALGLNNKTPEPESEEDEPSQVKNIHALRTEGENSKFIMGAQSTIDEIADRGRLGKSVRRSAMLDFCTQMADKEFMGRLLNSSLTQQLLASIGYTGEIIFDFAASMAVAFILEAHPDFAILEEIAKSGIMTTLAKLLDMDTDISRIAKDRKTNLSKVGREDVEKFRSLVHGSSLWSCEDIKESKLDKVTPQMVALRTLELLVLGLRKVGSTDALVDEGVVSKILDIASKPAERLENAKATSQDLLALHSAFSTLEALAISKEKRASWSSNALKRVAHTTAIFYTVRQEAPIKLATRLAILLTNNKPKACDVFAGTDFVKPLICFITDMFAHLANEEAEAEAEASEERDSLILALGAMINIAEFSDRARLNVVQGGDGEESMQKLVKTFLEGSERAAQADSLDSTTASIPIGYLTVLLGNLALNDSANRHIRNLLPSLDMQLLIEKVKEFVSFHERLDRLTGAYEGDEGREVSRMYTKRLMGVVKKLEEKEG